MVSSISFSKRCDRNSYSHEKVILWVSVAPLLFRTSLSTCALNVHWRRKKLSMMKHGEGFDVASSRTMNLVSPLSLTASRPPSVGSRPGNSTHLQRRRWVDSTTILPFPPSAFPSLYSETEWSIVRIYRCTHFVLVSAVLIGALNILGPILAFVFTSPASCSLTFSLPSTSHLPV